MFIKTTLSITILWALVAYFLSIPTATTILIVLSLIGSFMFWYQNEKPGLNCTIADLVVSWASAILIAAMTYPFPAVFFTYIALEVLLNLMWREGIWK